MASWKAWGALLGLISVLAGGVWGADRLVTSWHPAAVAPPTATQAVAQATAVQAEVDPGTSLHKWAPNFTLTDQNGRTVSLQQFRGRVVVLSFIDSRCTTVCPLTAVVLRNVRQDLGAYRHDVQLLAVNANPTATSVADVRQWSVQHHMGHQWDYLTGSAAALKAVWAHYYVSSQVLKGGVVQHIPAVYVIGPHGLERWLYINASDGSAPVLTAQVHHLMAHIAPLLPGHPTLHQFPQARELTYLAGTLGPTGQAHRFSAPAIRPDGHLTLIQVGHGGAPTLLDFFATWCPDCQEEVPVLTAYQHEAVRHHLPPVAGVNLRLSEVSTAQVQHYVVRTRLPYPVALDTTGAIAAAYGVSGIPTEVLVSPTGHILWYHQGLISLSALQTAVRQHVRPVSHG